MNKLAHAVLFHKKTVLTVFIIVAAACLLMMQLVKINYSMSDYLPADAPSTAALKVMEDNFPGGIPNAGIYVPGLTVPAALDLKDKITSVTGVTSVMWLDDVIDVRKPLETADPQTVEAWYKDGAALFSVTIESTNAAEAIAEIRVLIGSEGAISGTAANTAAVDATMGDVSKIMLFVVPLVLLVLLLTTSSWLEPLLFLVTIGVAILLNEGTNLFFGEISFVTRATSAILQLAVSMDYAVFLLHEFARNRKESVDLREAMQKSMVRSFSAIAASAMTTVFGFLALTLMRFRIGPDMGVVLAKGVLLSFLSVTILLPVMTLYMTKIMDKTHHRSLIPSFKRFSGLVLKICIPLMVIILLVIPVSYLAQQNNTFVYGSSGMNSENSQITKDTAVIESTFGGQVQMVLMVPTGQAALEAALERELNTIEDITSVISYNSMVGVEVPAEFLDEDIIRQFRSGGYSRMIIYAATNDESDRAFAAVEGVRDAAARYYGSSYHLLGASVINLDLKNTIVGDNTLVLLAAVVAIGLIIMLTFRSLSIPLLLLLTIEAATWINLGLPYFTGEKFNFIGYQIISSVQLGATVDYGILFAQHYLTNRKLLGKKDAVRQTIMTTAASILAPASMLAIAGLTLGLVSQNGLISQLGSVLGRGAVISAAMVLLVLPALLMVFDKIIWKTTLQGEPKKENHMKKALAKTLTILMICSLLIIPSSAVTALTRSASTTAGQVMASESQPKEEVIYVNLGNDGTVTGAYVVNSFLLAKPGTIVDYGRYDSVVNLSTTDEIAADGEQISVSAPAGIFYYQGNTTSISLPWLIDVEYTLNGKAADPAQLAGASGRLVIQISIRANPLANETFTANYAVQTSLTLDTALCSAINADKGTVANSGGDKIVSFIALPGADAEFEVSMLASGFEMSGITISAVPLSLNVDVPDMSNLTKQLADLREGIVSLDSGVIELDNGAAEMADGAGQISDGMLQMKDGLAGLLSGMKTLVAGNNGLQGGSSQIKNAIIAIKSGLDSIDTAALDLSGLAAGSSAIYGGIRNLSDGLDQLSGSFALTDSAIAAQSGGAYDSLTQANQQTISALTLQVTLLQADPVGNALQIQQLSQIIGLLTANNELVSGLKTGINGDGTAANPGLAAGAASLAEQYASFDAAVQQLPGQISELAAGIAQLQDAMRQLSANYSTFDSGLASYLGGAASIYNGLKSLETGFVELKAGSEKLSDGASQLAEGTDKLAEGTGELNVQTASMNDDVQARLDEYLAPYMNKDFEIVSFMSPRNTTVTAVQFVLKTSGIFVEPEVVEPSEPVDQTIWERFLALFSR